MQRKEILMSDRLGVLVKKFESGSQGSMSFSNCGNDYGLSCGTFQMTLRWGNCIYFLKKYYPTLSASLYFNNNKSDFSSHDYPGSEYCSSPDEVKAIWLKCYNQNLSQFEDNEYAHIKANYYDSLIKKLSGLFTPNNRAIQECLWSWAVHRGSGGAYSDFKIAMTSNGITNPQTENYTKVFDACYNRRYEVSQTNRYSTSSSSEREALRPYLQSPLFGETQITDSQKGVSSMSKFTASQLIAIAKAQIGYKEKATNANLDDPSANAGSNNWTKYARDLYAAGYYNGNKNGYAWCDVFVDWCFYQLCNKDSTKAQYIECQTGDCGAGCKYSAQYYKNLGRYYTSNPKVGDQIFFGDFDHTGIVETVSATQITTIEGNTSNQVNRRTYSLSDSYITGFGRPRYDEETTVVTPPQTVVTTPEKEGSSMDIITAYATKNDCYKKGTPMTPVGIVVHSTGANNPNLKRYVDAPDEVGTNQYGNHWNNPSSVMGRQVCVHAFIGYDKNDNVRVANILPYNYACWGVGSGNNGSFNYNPTGHIQFEMCEDGLTDATYCKQVYNVAVEYSAYLCKKFGLDPLGKNVIVSHKEACALGYGSNHGDPNNWWDRHGLTMDQFRAAVKAKMGSTVVDSGTTTQQPAVTTTEMYRIRKTWADSKSQIGAYKVLENAKKSCPEGYSVFNSKGEAVYTNAASTVTTPVQQPTTTAKTFVLTKAVGGYNSAADAKYHKNQKATLSAGTYYIYSKYPTGYNGMYNITKDSTGKAPGSWINPADNTATATATPAYTPAVGDKIIVNGTIAEYGNGKGNQVPVTNKTMYVKELISSKVYANYIGVSLTKTSARYGWVKLSSIKKA